MSILLTGGSSQTGLLIAKRLVNAGRSVLFASLPGQGPQDYKSADFDWYKPDTYPNPFNADSTIDSVYLLPPPNDHAPAKAVNPFIDFALAQGVKRFVLLSGAHDTNPDGGLKLVERYLSEKASDYFIVKPTWFQENFKMQAGEIIRAGTITTTTATGKLAPVAVSDVAQVAYDALISEANELKSKTVVGPELLDFNEIAQVFSQELGKPITHNVVERDVMFNILHTKVGMPEPFANFILELYQGIEQGRFSEHDGIVDETIAVGRVTLKDWIRENKALFTAPPRN